MTEALKKYNLYDLYGFAMDLAPEVVALYAKSLDWQVHPKVDKVIFNDPATIIYWNDGTKTVVKCQGDDTFSKETGLMAAMLKRFMGNDNTYNKVINGLLKKFA